MANPGVFSSRERHDHFRLEHGSDLLLHPTHLRERVMRRYISVLRNDIRTALGWNIVIGFSHGSRIRYPQVLPARTAAYREGP